MGNTRLIVQDEEFNLLKLGMTDLKFKKMTIVSFDGLEGRFYIEESRDGFVKAMRLPVGTNEEEFLEKMKHQEEAWKSNVDQFRKSSLS